MSFLYPKVCMCVLLSIRIAECDFCSTFPRSGVPLDLIVGNQSEPVPLCNITDGKC